MIPHSFLKPMMHHPVCRVDVQLLNNTCRIYAANQVWWPSLSLPASNGDFVYCHWEYDVFTSPHSPPFPLPEPFTSLEAMQTAAQDDHMYPWLPMVPTAPQFDYPLLDGLSLKSPKALEIITNPLTTFTLKGESITSSTYHLNNKSLSTWVEVKDQLLYLAYALAKSKNKFLGKVKPPAPHKYGYKKSHPTADAALKAACDSHLAFCILMGYCGFCMSAHTSRYSHITGPHNNDIKWWWEFALTKENVPHNIINLVATQNRIYSMLVTHGLLWSFIMVVWCLYTWVILWNGMCLYGFTGFLSMATIMATSTENSCFPPLRMK